jgi:RNA polymerase sigma factor (sigma-70 family)
MPDAEVGSAPEDDDRNDLVASRDDPARFGRVFERHVVAIYRYAARRVGIEEAEDVTATTFADAFRNRSRFDPMRASGRAWLFGIATTTIQHHRRSEARRHEAQARVLAPVEPALTADLIIAQLEDSARLDSALAAINTELRDVVMLIAVAELSYDECATALRVPIGTVQSRMWRARQQLRALLGDGELTASKTARLDQEGQINDG